LVSNQNLEVVLERNFVDLEAVVKTTNNEKRSIENLILLALWQLAPMLVTTINNNKTLEILHRSHFSSSKH
jgi:hypothetical protein